MVRLMQRTGERLVGLVLPKEEAGATPARYLQLGQGLVRLRTEAAGGGRGRR